MAPDGGATTDAGSDDAGPLDAGPTDGGPTDAGPTDTGSRSDAGSPDDPLGLCPGSTLMHFSLTPLTSLPPLSAIDMPNLPQNANVVSAGEGLDHSARLDVCDEGGVAVLRAVLWNQFELSTPQLYRLDETITTATEDVIEIDDGTVIEYRLPPSEFVVEGLGPALTGVLSGLEVRMVHDSGLLMVGHDGFVAVAGGRVGAATIEYTSLDITAGGLAPGDVFAGLGCPFGEQPHATAFMMATAQFDVQACTFLGGGFTTGYRITKLVVQDSSPELTVAEQAPVELNGQDEVEAVMNYVWNHHNACDSFYLDLPHAGYAASTAPAAGCGATVPEAPPRDINEDPSSPVKFRVRYHGGAWTEGSIPGCTHYMFCNP